MKAHAGATAGSVLVEMLVALACTSLLAGAVLSMLADAARVCQERRSRVEARALATAAADLIAGELGRAGHGLEGAEAIRPGGGAVPVLEPGEDVFGVAYAAAPAAEVRDEGGGRYGLPGSAASAGIEVDGEVAALGEAGALPVGRVFEVQARSHGDLVTVSWPGSAPALVRALVPLRRRELGLVPDGELWQLRQRAVGGRWQPSVDGLAEVIVQFGDDVDADGNVDAWRPAAPGAVPAAIRVRVVARLPSGATEMAERRLWR